MVGPVCWVRIYGVLRRNKLVCCSREAAPGGLRCVEYFRARARSAASEGEEGARHLRTSPHDRHTIIPRLFLRTFLHGTLPRPGSLCSRSAACRWRSDDALIMSLCGPDGSGKRLLADSVASELGMTLIYLDVEAALSGKLPFDQTVWLAARECVLQSPAPISRKPAAFCLENVERFMTDGDNLQPQIRSLVKAMETFPDVAFVIGTRPWMPQDLIGKHAFVKVEFPAPDAEARRYIWESQIDGYEVAADVDLGALASKFRFTHGQVRDALYAARNQARWRSGGQPDLTEEGLYTACRAQSDEKLAALTRKIRPRYTWDDIVLQEDALAQLRELCQWVEFRDRVLGEWGFGTKLSGGKGVNALFSGPSGTGKTMAAEVVANALRLDLSKIDLSQVVSKCIGETEKNLDAIFAGADKANAIICFDEVDSLFGKRSEVRDSHDRYANIEISYLLQKMEEYEGVAILASNLRQNLDDAFVRRLTFTVHFPFPDNAERRRIWASIWPRGTLLAEDVDFEFLSRQFKMSGGNIRNIALAAAFLAAKDGGAITMAHLLHGTRREYQKLGKPLTSAEMSQAEPEPADSVA